MKTLLDWFRDRRSRNIANLMLEHLIKVIDTNNAFKEALHYTIENSSNKKTIFAAIEAVHLNEKAGDSIKMDLNEAISGASFLPSRYILIGLGCGNYWGLLGALFHLFNHATFKGLLFLNSEVC